ncbi:chorismate--pyruvate lyase family protein [Halocatena halophila]|uniref:chorismate--pyruvate lyase family protein n=1 Tax=Halocatena halophila TaxID=2814576 RepID=UPI002ED27287
MSIDEDTFSPIERVILTHDGTVTRMLEALTGQPITVTILARYIRGDTLYRTVALESALDPDPLVWATSEVDLQSLDPQYEAILRDQDIGIGAMFWNEQFETFRELVDFDSITAQEQFPSFINANTSKLLKRTYTIYHEKNNIMDIVEYFPKDKFEKFIEE